jgi:moderate conductance mechanosensitive channel
MEIILRYIPNGILVVAAEILILIVVCVSLDRILTASFNQIAKQRLLNKGATSIKRINQNVRRILTLVGVLSCLTILGFNAWLFYQGKDLAAYTLGLIQNIPSDFWRNLAGGIAKSILLTMLVALLLKPLHQCLRTLSEWAQAWQPSTLDDQSFNDFFGSIDRLLTHAAWGITLISCTQFLGFPEAIVQFPYIGLRIYLIIAGGLLIFRVVAVVVDSLDVLSMNYSSSERVLRYYTNLRHLVPFLKRCLEYIVYVTMASLVIQQVSLIAGFAIYGSKAIQIIGIVFSSRILISITHLLIEEVLLKSKGLTESERQQRMTLAPLLTSSLKYFIYFGTAIATLYTIEIDPTPFLAGAGILGLAVGLGAQNLINDIVSGFFILFEDYYVVGDYIEMGEIQGLVEAIELRSSRIRHPNGQLQIVPNGKIELVINYSKQYVYAAVEVEVNYDLNLDHVYEILEAVGRQLQQDFSEHVLEPTTVEGIESFGEENLSILTCTKVQPGKHLKMQRILRKYIKDSFDQAGIEMAAKDPIFILSQPPRSSNQLKPKNSSDSRVDIKADSQSNSHSNSGSFFGKVKSKFSTNPNQNMR